MKVMKIVLGVIVVIVIILAIAALELWSQVGRYQAYWNRQNAQSLQAGELLYVALGDSTAQGIGASQPKKGYVGLVAKELASKEGKQVHIVNLSKTGAKLSDVLERQLPLMKQQPIDDKTVVTIEIGANDMSSFEPQRFEKDMNEIIDQLPKQTVVSDMPYFGGGRHKSSETAAEQASEIIRRLAKQHKLKVAGLHDLLQQNDGWRIYALDQFHPSNTGYRIWAQAFLGQL